MASINMNQPRVYMCPRFFTICATREAWCMPHGVAKKVNKVNKLKKKNEWPEQWVSTTAKWSQKTHHPMNLTSSLPWHLVSQLPRDSAVAMTPGPSSPSQAEPILFADLLKSVRCSGADASRFSHLSPHTYDSSSSSPLLSQTHICSDLG